LSQPRLQNGGNGTKRLPDGLNPSKQCGLRRWR
jgi:hypothetical protein